MVIKSSVVNNVVIEYKNVNGSNKRKAKLESPLVMFSEMFLPLFTTSSEKAT